MSQEGTPRNVSNRNTPTNPVTRATESETRRRRRGGWFNGGRGLSWSVVVVAANFGPKYHLCCGMCVLCHTKQQRQHQHHPARLNIRTGCEQENWPGLSRGGDLCRVFHPPSKKKKSSSNIRMYVTCKKAAESTTGTYQQALSQNGISGTMLTAEGHHAANGRRTH